MDLRIQDFEEINIEQLRMVAKLLMNFVQGMQKVCITIKLEKSSNQSGIKSKAMTIY